MSERRTAEERINEFIKAMRAEPCFTLVPDWTLFEHENKQKQVLQAASESGNPVRPAINSNIETKA